MANNKKNQVVGFEFKPFSKKQLRILTFWHENSPVKDRFMIVADGAIRSGKSVVSSLSFILYVMHKFNGLDAGLAGKSVGSLRRNIVNPLKQMVLSLDGYEIIEHRSENYFTLYYGNKFNNFYLFGGRSLPQATEMLL